MVVVDDDHIVTSLVKHVLSNAGFAVEATTDPAMAVELARSHRASVAIVDQMLPGADGCEVLRQLRGEPSLRSVAVLMLSARGTTEDHVHGPREDTDDDLAKPCDIDELVLQVQRLEARTRPAAAAEAAVPSGDARCGRCHVRDAVGRGGMGAVSRTRDAILQRWVAVARHPAVTASGVRPSRPRVAAAAGKGGRAAGGRLRTAAATALLVTAALLLATPGAAEDLAALAERLAGTQGQQRLEVLSDLAFGSARTDQEAALGYARELLEEAKAQGNRSAEAAAHNHMALAHRYLGSYQAALEHAQECLRIRQEIGEPDGEAAALGNLGVLCWRLEQHDRALDYLGQALAIRRGLGDPRALAPTLNNLALVHMSRNELEQAAACYQEIIDLPGSGDSPDLNRYLANMAELQLALGQPRRALELSFRSIELKRSLGDEGGLAGAMYVVGRAHQQLGDLVRARQALREALGLAVGLGDLNSQMEIHLALSDIEAARGRYREALEHFRSHADVRARLFSEDGTRRVEQLQARFDLEQKEHEIALLRSEQRLHDSELGRQRNIRDLLAFLLALTAVFAVVGARLYRAANRAQRALGRRNDELEALDGIIHAVNQEVDLPQVMRTLLERSLGFVRGAEVGAFLVRDAEQDCYRRVAHSGSAADSPAPVELSGEDIRRRYANGASELATGIYRRAARDAAEPATLAVMIEIESELAGVLLLASHGDAQAFDRCSPDQLARLRAHAVSAIDRSRILADARREKERAEAALAELQLAHAELERLSKSDPLTGLDNRRGILDTLAVEAQRSRRSGHSFAVLLGDIDDFKLFNDRFGHDCGDDVLRWIGRQLRARTRGQDRVCRWGGEEFLVLLPETDLTGAVAVAENIRATLAASTLLHRGQSLVVTMTFGAAAHLVGEPPEASIQAADQALLQGKREGKNRVVAAAPGGGAATR